MVVVVPATPGGAQMPMWCQDQFILSTHIISQCTVSFHSSNFSCSNACYSIFFSVILFLMFGFLSVKCIACFSC